MGTPKQPLLISCKPLRSASMEQEEEEEGFQSEPEVILIQPAQDNSGNDENKENEEESDDNEANGQDEDEVTPRLSMNIIQSLIFRHRAARFA